MSKKRGSFSGGLGFVFAAAGSAVGLGNLWRFPYYAAKYGGGTFIFIYIILALTFGFSLLTAEIAIGRKTKLLHHANQRHGNDSKQNPQDHCGFGQHFVESFFLSTKQCLCSTSNRTRKSGAFPGLKNNGCD